MLKFCVLRRMGLPLRRGGPGPLAVCLGLCAAVSAPVAGWHSGVRVIEASGHQVIRSSGHHPPAPVLLRLRSGSFDPVRTVSNARVSAVTRQPDPRTVSDLYLVQFTGPIRLEWQRALEAAGAAVIEYVPDFAYLVQATPEKAAKFERLPGYRWHGTFEGMRGPATGTGGAASVAAAAGRAASRLGEPLLVDVMTFPGADVRALTRRLPGRVLERYARRRGFLRVQLPALRPGEAWEQKLAQVAALPGVSWAEPYVPPVLFSDVASGIMRVPAVREELGLYGRGQVVAVADTGLDAGSIEGISADFRGRVQRGYAMNRSVTGDWSDLHGHGTHVCGALLGAGVLSGADPALHSYDGSYAGVAPEANLVMQSIGDASGTLAVPTDLGQLFLRPYKNDGARIHCDSWGSGSASVSGQYLLNSWQIDDVCWQTRDLVVLFAAGNGGADLNGDGVVDPNGLSPQAAAKNVIAVGASESQREQSTTWGAFPPFPSDPLQGDRLADSPVGMAAFSSRGPTADGRIKPDVVAPGTWIVSSRSHAPGAGTLWGAVSAHYAYSGGTSMATPLVAGAAALLREGLQKRFGIANPSSALVKALLINGADELAPGQYGVGTTREIPPRPNPIEGWGRVNVRHSLPPGGGVWPVDDARGLQTEERRKWTVTVTGSEVPLRVTLVWTDPPSSLLAGTQLVNDLDLKLLAPDGRWLYGNGGTDRRNNVEAIELLRPAPGTYTLVVDGYNVPQGPQPFALVAAGPIPPAASGAGGPSGGGLRVRLRAAGMELPLAGTDVAVGGTLSLNLTANAAGQIEARLPAGSYTLRPSKPGWTFDPPVRSVTLADAQSLSVEFTGTAPNAALSGSVTDRAGAGVAGARLLLSPGSMTAVTDAAGAYRFPTVPPLVYTVTPSLAGTAFTPELRRVRVAAGSPTRADFATAAGAVSGTVVGAGVPERQSIASAHPVRTAGTQSWTVSRPGARWIRVHFPRIDVQPGTERVEVLDVSGRLVNRWSGAFTDLWSTWVAGSAVIVRHTSGGIFARFGFEIDLVQTDLRGAPLRNALVHLQPTGRATRTDIDGFFRFSGLPNASFALAPALAGWEFFPPVASLTLPPGAPEGSVTFLAQGPPALSGQAVVTGTTQPARYESLHPYAHRSALVQEIAVPGATRLRLHFQRLSTEFGADFVRLFGPAGTELKRYSGARTDFWTDWLPAGRVTVRLDSDDSINDWGYLIDGVASDSGAGGIAAGASVTLSPGDVTAPIRPDGSYILPHLAAGVYSLTIAGSGLQFVPPSLTLTLPAWGLGAVDFEATRQAPPSAPGVLAALSPTGQPQVQGLLAGAWAPLPAPGGGPFQQLLALQGVNDTPELIALAGGRIVHSRYAGGEWTPWQPVRDASDTEEGPVTPADAEESSQPSPPAVRPSAVAAAELDGTLNVLIATSDGSVQHYRFVNGTWQEPGVAAGVPRWKDDWAALTARADGTLELVGADAEGRLLHSRFINGIWTTPGPVGDRLTARRPTLAVAAGGSASAMLELVFVDEEGSVLHQQFRAGAWSAPRGLRTAEGPLLAAGSPALAAGPDGLLDLVVPAQTGLYHARMLGGSWSDAQRISDLVAHSVALAPPADRSAALELFTTRPDGSVTHLRFRDGRWTSPSLLENLLATSITATAR